MTTAAVQVLERLSHAAKIIQGRLSMPLSRRRSAMRCVTIRELIQSITVDSRGRLCFKAYKNEWLGMKRR